MWVLSFYATTSAPPEFCYWLVVSQIKRPIAIANSRIIRMMTTHRNQRCRNHPLVWTISHHFDSFCSLKLRVHLIIFSIYPLTLFFSLNTFKPNVGPFVYRFIYHHKPFAELKFVKCRGDFNTFLINLIHEFYSFYQIPMNFFSFP